MFGYQRKYNNYVTRLLLFDRSQAFECGPIVEDWLNLLPTANRFTECHLFILFFSGYLSVLVVETISHKQLLSGLLLQQLSLNQSKRPDSVKNWTRIILNQSQRKHFLEMISFKTLCKIFFFLWVSLWVFGRIEMISDIYIKKKTTRASLFSDDTETKNEIWRKNY